MSLNTRNRRASAIGFLHPSVRVFPNPDGSLAAQEDRQQISWAYVGILILPPRNVTVLSVSRRNEPPPISVAIYPPIGHPRHGSRMDWEDINPYLTAARWSTAMPMGWHSFEVGIEREDIRYHEPLARPYLPRELRWMPFAHVSVKLGSATVFEGRMGPIQRVGGRVGAFTVNGYGKDAIRDDYYRSTDTTDTTTGVIIREMVADVAPQLRIAPEGWFDDPLVTHDRAEFHFLFLEDVLEQLVAEGDGYGNLMDWWVYEHQQLAVKARVAPERPHYQLPFDHRVVSWNEDPTQMAGAVAHERLSSGTATKSTTEEVSTRFVETYGFQRSTILKLGEITDAAALEFRKTYLNVHSRPIASCQIEIGPDDVLTGPGGRVVPAWKARAGEWVQVGNEPMQMIVGTEYDATSRVLRILAGEQPPNWSTMLARLERDRLKMRRGINGWGGRAR